jgi:hypothetical protein
MGSVPSKIRRHETLQNVTSCDRKDFLVNTQTRKWFYQ